MREPRKVVACAAAFCAIALLGGGDLWAEKPTTTITGTVKRAEVRQGKVMSVYIEDPDQGEFLVVRGTTIGKELLKHVGATINATGYVREPTRDLDFEKAIDILSYEITEPGE